MPGRALTPGEQRKRALIDAGVALVITMLIWPFPLARATLTPVVNVLLVLLTWDIINVVYHVVCARFWRRTAAMYLLGYSLAEKTDSDAAPSPMRWGFMSGAFVVVTTVWPGASGIVEETSGLSIEAS